MAEARAFCPHCYAPVIAGRKTCPKCGRNVSDAPPSSAVAKKRGGVTFALLGALVVVALVAAWLFLK